MSADPYYEYQIEVKNRSNKVCIDCGDTYIFSALYSIRGKRCPKCRFQQKVPHLIHRLEIWNSRCAYCDGAADVFDHVISISQIAKLLGFSGSAEFRGQSEMAWYFDLEDEENMIPCCRCCNQHKLAKDMQQWYSPHPAYTPERFHKIVKNTYYMFPNYGVYSRACRWTGKKHPLLLSRRRIPSRRKRRQYLTLTDVLGYKTWWEQEQSDLVAHKETKMSMQEMSNGEDGQMPIDLEIIDAFLNPIDASLDSALRETLLEVRAKLVAGETMTVDEFARFVDSRDPHGVGISQ